MLGLTEVDSRAVSLRRTNRVSRSLISIAALSSSWTGLSLGGVNLVDIALALTTLALLLDALRGNRRLWLSFWMVAPPVGVLIATANAVVLLGYPLGLSADFMLRLFLSTTLVAVLVHSERGLYGIDRLRRVLGFWAIGVALSAAVAILSSLELVNLAEIVDAPLAGNRAVGLAFHPNSLAFSLVLAIPVQMYFCVTGANRRIRWAAAVAFAVCVYALFPANSRSGLLIGLVVGVLSVAVGLRFSRARWMAVPLAILGSVAIVFWVLPLLEGTRLAAGSGNQSDAVRSRYNSLAWEGIQSHPMLGGGFTNMEGVSIPLNLLTAGGFFLAALYYLFVFVGAAPLLRGGTGVARWFGRLALVAFLAFGITGNGIAERSTFWPILLMAGIALTLRDPDGAHISSGGRPRQSPA
jgi:hypothetical protein